MPGTFVFFAFGLRKLGCFAGAKVLAYVIVGDEELLP